MNIHKSVFHNFIENLHNSFFLRQALVWPPCKKLDNALTYQGPIRSEFCHFSHEIVKLQDTFLCIHTIRYTQIYLIFYNFIVA